MPLTADNTAEKTNVRIFQASFATEALNEISDKRKELNMNCYGIRILGSIGLFLITVIFIGCASTGVQTLTYATIDEVQLAFNNSEVTQAKQQVVSPVMMLNRYRTPSGKWDFKIEPIGRPGNATLERKEGDCYIITELSLLKRPSRKIAIKPNMLKLVEIGTTNSWEGEALWIPNSKKETLEEPAGAWTPIDTKIFVSPDGIEFSYEVWLLGGKISEQERQETGLIAIAPSGRPQITGRLQTDRFRLLFTVPKDSCQKQLNLKLLDRTIAELPKFSLLPPMEPVGTKVETEHKVMKRISGEVTAFDAAIKTITVKGRKSEVTVSYDDKTTFTTEKGEEAFFDVKVGNRLIINYTNVDGKNVAKRVYEQH